MEESTFGKNLSPEKNPEKKWRFYVDKVKNINHEVLETGDIKRFYDLLTSDVVPILEEIYRNKDSLFKKESEDLLQEGHDGYEKSELFSVPVSSEVHVEFFNMSITMLDTLESLVDLFVEQKDMFLKYGVVLDSKVDYAEKDLLIKELESLSFNFKKLLGEIQKLVPCVANTQDKVFAIRSSRNN